MRRKLKTSKNIMDLKTISIIALGLLSPFMAFSQDSEKVDSLNMLDQRMTLVEDAIVSGKKLKISGYLQPQFQSSQVDSMGSGPRDMKVGKANNAAETDKYNRFGIRRGRLKATYNNEGYVGVLEFEMTEKSITLKNGFVQAIDPWIGYISLKGGVYDRPSGTRFLIRHQH